MKKGRATPKFEKVLLSFSRLKKFEIFLKKVYFSAKDPQKVGLRFSNQCKILKEFAVENDTSVSRFGGSATNSPFPHPDIN